VGNDLDLLPVVFGANPPQIGQKLAQRYNLTIVITIKTKTLKRTFQKTSSPVVRELIRMTLLVCNLSYPLAIDLRLVKIRDHYA
jgi:hypothetical protein